MRWEQSRGPSYYAACLDTCHLIVESIMICTNKYVTILSKMWSSAISCKMKKYLTCYEEPKKLVC